MFVNGGVDTHRRAACAVAPQGFAETLAVLRNDGVGGIEDGLGRAVVLFEADGGKAGVVVFQLQDIFDARATPAVDGLIVITNDEELRATRAELLDKAVLQGVGVLKFVHEDALETLLVVAQYVGVVGKEFDSEQEQFGEVHRALLAAEAFVIGVEIAHSDVGRVRIGRDVGRAQAVFFPGVDLPDKRFRLDMVFVPLPRTHHAFHHAQLVIAVHDNELFRPAE